MVHWAFTILLLVCALGLARAGCPHECSGNGNCGVNSKCTCLPGFIGGDCSKRACFFRSSPCTAVHPLAPHVALQMRTCGIQDRVPSAWAGRRRPPTLSATTNSPSAPPPAYVTTTRGSVCAIKDSTAPPARNVRDACVPLGCCQCPLFPFIVWRCRVRAPPLCFIFKIMPRCWPV